MTRLSRHPFTHPLLALGSTLLWGMIELLALQRSRLLDRRSADPSRPDARAAG